MPDLIKPTFHTTDKRTKRGVVKMRTRILNQYRVLGITQQTEKRMVQGNIFAFCPEQAERIFLRSRPRHTVSKIRLEKQFPDSVINLDDYKAAKEEHLLHTFAAQNKAVERQWIGAILHQKMLQAVKSQSSLLEDAWNIGANPIICVWG
jgi:hypothetical protein